VNTDTGEIRRFKKAITELQKKGGNWEEVNESEIEKQIGKLIADPTVKKIVIRKNRSNEVMAVIPTR